MTEPITTDLDPSFSVRLERIEFSDPNDIDEPPPDGMERHYFIFKAETTQGFFIQIPVTMVHPPKNLDDLTKEAWIELYAILAQFAEVTRRQAKVPPLVFRD